MISLPHHSIMIHLLTQINGACCSSCRSCRLALVPHSHSKHSAYNSPRYHCTKIPPSHAPWNTSWIACRNLDTTPLRIGFRGEVEIDSCFDHSRRDIDVVMSERRATRIFRERRWRWRLFVGRKPRVMAWLLLNLIDIIELWRIVCWFMEQNDTR